MDEWLVEEELWLDVVVLLDVELELELLDDDGLVLDEDELLGDDVLDSLDNDDELLLDDVVLLEEELELEVLDDDELVDEEDVELLVEEKVDELVEEEVDELVEDEVEELVEEEVDELVEEEVDELVEDEVELHPQWIPLGGRHHHSPVHPTRQIRHDNVLSKRPWNA